MLAMSAARYSQLITQDMEAALQYNCSHGRVKLAPAHQGLALYFSLVILKVSLAFKQIFLMHFCVDHFFSGQAFISFRLQ